MPDGSNPLNSNQENQNMDLPLNPKPSKDNLKKLNFFSNYPANKDNGSQGKKGSASRRIRFFRKEVSTMQDDIANLIASKNRKAGKKNGVSNQRRDIQRNLTEVYTDGDGKIPDLTKLERIQRPLWKTVLYVLIAVLAVLLVAAIAGFYFFNNLNNQDAFTNEKVALKIETPIAIVSGQEMVYTITITNKEKVNLYNAELELFYPDNFEYVSAEPVALGDKKNTWDFAVIKTGETQKIQLTGKILAPLNSTQTIKGTLNFKPSNLNATFKQEAIVDVVVSASNISLDVTGPEKTLANQKVEYVIKYKNTGQDDLSDLQLVAEYPDGFVFNSSDPEPQNDNGNNNVWAIKALKQNAEGQLKIKGDYSAVQTGGNRDFKVRVQLKKDNDYYPQSETSFVTTIIKDQLSLQLIINGSAEDQPINFDDLLVYSLSFKNTGQEELKDIKIFANMNSQILDWNTLKDDRRGSRSQNSIVWTGKEAPKLLKLAPGEEGQINWSIRVKDSSVINDKNVNKFNVESYIEGRASQSGEASGESIVKSKTVVNAINSDLGLNAYARYYDEDNMALGAGPIQPTVGEKSSYNIKLELANNLHDVKDLLVVATLPKGAEWAGQETHTAGDLNFNQQAKKITWTISRLAKSANKVAATFNVGLNPGDDDFGKVLILISEIQLTGKDAETGADISKSLKAITTSFDDPILGQVSGIVK
ncbi:MAG: hypothetical protein WC610_00420 [Patescibacteria group bacterium]